MLEMIILGAVYNICGSFLYISLSTQFPLSLIVKEVTLQSHVPYRVEKALPQNSGHGFHIEPALSDHPRYEDYLPLIQH